MIINQHLSDLARAETALRWERRGWGMSGRKKFGRGVRRRGRWSARHGWEPDIPRLQTSLVVWRLGTPERWTRAPLEDMPVWEEQGEGVSLWRICRLAISLSLTHPPGIDPRCLLGGKGGERRRDSSRTHGVGSIIYFTREFNCRWRLSCTILLARQLISSLLSSMYIIHTYVHTYIYIYIASTNS